MTALDEQPEGTEGMDEDHPEDEVSTDDELTAADPESAAISDAAAETEAEKAIHDSLVSLGFVNLDSGSNDNTTTDALVAEDRRRHFRRDVYVGVRDDEQDIEFLGRVVEGPFHAPHEIGSESAITRTTVLHPERTRFRPTYYVHGSIEILGALGDGERLIPTPTRPRPYSEIFIFPPGRLQKLLGIEGNFNLGELMGYEGVGVMADVENKNFLPRNVGVFGTVGSGKSNTTQVLMEEAVDAGWAVVVIDVEGEYVRMNEPNDRADLTEILATRYGLSPTGFDDFKVYVPHSGHSDAEDSNPFKVPIAALELGVLTDIMDFSEPQVRMFSSITAQAIRDASKRSSGSSRTSGLTGEGTSSELERPYTLGDLIDGLQEDEDGKIPLVKRKLQAGERSSASTLRWKLVHLGRSQMLDWGMTKGVKELPVDDLLVSGRLSVLDVSETDDRSRNIAIAYTLQALFDRVIQADVGERMPNGLPRPKVLVVMT